MSQEPTHFIEQVNGDIKIIHTSLQPIRLLKKSQEVTKKFNVFKIYPKSFFVHQRTISHENK